MCNIENNKTIQNIYNFQPYPVNHHHIQLLILLWRKYYYMASSNKIIVILTIQTSGFSADMLYLKIWMWGPEICISNKCLIFKCGGA